MTENINPQIHSENSITANQSAPGNSKEILVFVLISLFTLFTLSFSLYIFFVKYF